MTAGDYVVTADTPTGYTLTAVREVPVTLSGGSEIVLNFGAVAAESSPTVEAAAALASEPATPDQRASLRSTLIIVGAIAGGLTLLTGSGFAVYFLINRRKQSLID